MAFLCCYLLTKIGWLVYLWFYVTINDIPVIIFDGTYVDAFVDESSNLVVVYYINHEHIVNQKFSRGG